MKAATAKISLRSLEMLLGFGGEMPKITRVRQSWENERAGEFELLLEGGPLAPVPPGQPLPEVEIIVHSASCGHRPNSELH